MFKEPFGTIWGSVGERFKIHFVTSWKVRAARVISSHERETSELLDSHGAVSLVEGRARLRTVRPPKAQAETGRNRLALVPGSRDCLLPRTELK